MGEQKSIKQQQQEVLTKNKRQKAKQKQRRLETMEKLGNQNLSSFIKSQKKQFKVNPDPTQAYYGLFQPYDTGFLKDKANGGGDQIAAYCQEIKNVLDGAPTKMLKNAALSSVVKDMLYRLQLTDDPQHVRQVLEALAADDYQSIIHMLKMASPYIAMPALNYAHGYLKKKNWYKQYAGIFDPAFNAIQQYLGRGQNDVDNHSITTLSVNPVQMGSDNDQYNGICPEVISTIFAPKIFQSRLVEHEVQKASIASISTLYNVTTNASGNAYVHYALSAPCSAYWGAIYNDASLSLAGGTQTPAPLGINGPFSGAVANIANYRVAGCVFTIKKLPSALNQQGAVHLCTYDSALTTTRSTTTNTFQMGLNDATRAPFFTTLSLCDVDGQCVIYNPYANETLEAWLNGQLTSPESATQNLTGVWIALEGCNTSAQVIQIQVDIVLEYSATTAGSALTNYIYSPSGVATPQLVITLFKCYPMLRMLGKAERLKLAEMFGSIKPSNYDQALYIAKQFLSGVTLQTHTGGMSLGSGTGGGGGEVVDDDFMDVRGIPPTRRKGGFTVNY